MFEYSFDISMFQRKLPKGWTLQLIDNTYYTATNGQLRTPWFKSRGNALVYSWAMVVEVMHDG